ncbi:putative c6 transcription factor [Diplodia seriata]|uniref:Putative c6 transcription factor n=1 Tax=Diplodia seriata TaxID=420778 RepID=A0A0G2GYD1_9PEZI|nr:putative c6 transcription factor [Diplodia seriata]
MYSRRPHRNSHHGCRECKEKRVKVIIYAPGSSTGAILSPFDAALLEEGGAVFHHYVHVVKVIDPAHHASEQMWRWEKAIRAFAPSHDFLYYAVLAFASLHRSVLYRRSINNNTPSAGDAVARQQSDHLVAIASAYQSRALAAFAPAVASLQHAAQKGTNEGMGVRNSRNDGGGGGGGQNASLTDAVLTCSSIILASSFSFPPAPGEDVIDQARQVLQLFLGTFAVYDRAWEMDKKDRDESERENRGRYPASSSSSSNSDIGSYVLERMRAGEELGDGLPAPEAEASLDRVVDAVLLRAATTTTTTTTASPSHPSTSSPTFLAMLNPTLLYHTSTPTPTPSPISLTPQPPPPPPPAPANNTDPLSTFLPPLTALRTLFRRLAARPRLHTIALRWPAHLPAAFIHTALARRDPLALVVLAHWARCLAGFRGLWWVS